MQNPEPSLQSVLSSQTYQAPPLNSDLDRIVLIRQGIPVEVAVQVGEKLSLSPRTMAWLFGISPKTYRQKQLKVGVLSGAHSEKVIGLAEIYCLGMQAFEKPHVLHQWLRSPIVSLHQNQPIELLDTYTGQQLIIRVLWAILSGTYL